MCCLCFGFSLIQAGAVTLPQADDFQGGTTAGWAGNMLGVVTNLPAGGPDGAGDAFLLTALTNTAFHLGTKNGAQWSGDYLAAGVGAIEMDLNQLSPPGGPIRIRIVLFGPGGMFASSNLTAPLATNQWTHHVFGLTSNDLEYVAPSPQPCSAFPPPPGTTVLADTLAAVTTIIIRNDSEVPTPQTCHPPHIFGRLGIDNIRAVPRQPTIDGFQYNGTNATVAIGNLVAGISNVVQAADGLSPDSWSDATGFTAASDSTNVSLSTTQTLFRVMIP